MYLLYFFASHCLVLLILLHAIRQICVLVYLLLSVYTSKYSCKGLYCLYVFCPSIPFSELQDVWARIIGRYDCAAFKRNCLLSLFYIQELNPLGLALSLILAHK